MKYIEFIESTKAQVWYEKKSGLWTCQIIVCDQGKRHSVIQPSRSSLTAAIDDAMTQWDNLHTESRT